MDPAFPEPFTTTPAASGPVKDEESIPSSYPGTRVFQSVDDLVASRVVPTAELLAPAAIPAGYGFAGAYVVALDNGKVVDVSLSYRRVDHRYAGTLPEVFSPDLSIGWTSRAPEPLPAETEATDLGLGRKALPRVKVHVRGYDGVFAEVTNPDSIDQDLVVLSSVNWFDKDGRLWYVQAAEPLDTMLQLADSLKEPG
ncbi:MAG TPA: hypothetical protein VN697_15150 [Tepidiformaceae bacterium]|nr:hypothetical protein [Tepidiformaceae bacterium]